MLIVDRNIRLDFSVFSVVSTTIVTDCLEDSSIMYGVGH